MLFAGRTRVCETEIGSRNKLGIGKTGGCSRGVSAWEVGREKGQNQPWTFGSEGEKGNWVKG